jgi:hypothetical protein
MSPNQPIRLVWSLALLATLTIALAADIRCATCGKIIRGRYLWASGKAYCSQACHDAALPACATCNKPIRGQYLRHQERNYCSQACLNAALPKCTLCDRPLQTFVEIKGHVYCPEHANGPRCDACGLPMDRGRELPDKRTVCTACFRRIILDEHKARDIYQRARGEVERLTGLKLGELPPLGLVGRDAMPGNSQGIAMENIQERGYYRRSVNTDTYTDANGNVLRTEQQVEENIYILYGLTPEEFLCTAGHELTHALQARFLPHIHDNGPLWLKEGVCQYLAAAIARRHGYADELACIERSPHPDYGRGYRFLQQRFGDGNWPRLFAWLKALDPSTLPAELPADQIP